MTALSELRNLPHGTEVAGLALLIKTARKCTLDGDNLCWQEVVFMDYTGELQGWILQDAPPPVDPNSKYAGRHGGIAGKWKSRDRIVVMKGEMQAADQRGKEGVRLMITECFDVRPELTYDQESNLDAQSWAEVHKNEIRGKVRHWIVCSAIQANQITVAHGPMPREKAHIEAWVDFIIGE